MAAAVKLIQPVVSTGDATLKSASGYIHWITISNSHATEAAAVELANGGADVWGVIVEAIDFKLLPLHVNFDPPIYCDTSIILDITNGTVQVTVGFS